MRLLWFPFIFLFSLTAKMGEVHPIHLSVTEIYRNDQGDLEMSITFFMDDFSDAVQYDTYRPKIDNGEMTVDDLIMKYLKAHHEVEINGRPVEYAMMRKESNFPALTCYLNVEEVPPGKLSRLTVRNTMMLELFDDQRNMVHIRLSEREGSMMLDNKKTESTAEF